MLMVVMLAPVIGVAQEEGKPNEPGTEAKELKTKDVVVSATKTPIPVTQLTSSMEVITGEELQRKKFKTVADALRLAQGLSVLQSGGPGTEALVRMRGGNPEHVLVVIDGTIVNSPTNGRFNFGNLNAENIERIEILRGAQSMLWGSDAISGVINIITKKGKGKPTGNAFLEYGSFASLREGASAAGSKGPFDFTMALQRWDITSFSAADYRIGAFERDPFHQWQASGRVGVALPKDGRLEFNLRWWNSDLGLDSTGFDVFGVKQSTNQLLLSGVYDQPITSWWNQKLTLAQNEEHFGSGRGTFRVQLGTGVQSAANQTPSDFTIINQRLEWQHNFQVAEPLLLTVGYQHREESGSNPLQFGQKGIISNAGFAQAQVNLWDSLFLTGGLRQDSYNTFGDATTYRTTAGYLVSKTRTKLRGSYGTGFRTPTINQLFFPGFGTPGLKPEKSKSMDVGVDQWLFKDDLQVSVVYFWNRFTNLIQTLCANQACSISSAQNIGDAKSQGWETAFNYAVLKNLDLRGQYTYTLTRNVLNGSRLARWPVHMASAGVSYAPIEPLRVNLDFRFMGARFNSTDLTNRAITKMSPFNVFNLSATYDVMKNAQLFGRLDNMFDKEYEEISQFGTPIRSIYGGIKLTY
jgi:vitamin B12 transporter